MKRLILTLILFCWHTMAMATITMEIYPTTAQLGETLKLTLTQDHDTQFHGTPDLTPLKKEFTVVGTEHNMSYSAINGVAKSESQWIILLIAKKSGLLPIPSIRIGQQESPTGQVNITTHANTPLTNNQTERQKDDSAVTLQADLDQHYPYINQQIIYTVKLSTRQSLLDAQYHPPSVENALMIPLGDGRRYQTTLNGQEYSVDEQQYAIYPQKSGELQITPPQLTAVVYDTVPNRIHIEAKASKLKVKSIPEQYANKQWMPAKQVTLTEQYDSSASTIAEGSTLVRTITLRANGLPAELLPTLNFTDNGQFSVYPDKPETRNILRQQDLIGTNTIKVTYILNQSGNITLPSIELPWFNTLTNKPEIATLPSRDITITTQIGASDTRPVLSEQPHPIKPTSPSVMPTPVKQTTSIAWWLAGAFAAAWGLTLLLWWTLQHRLVATKPTIRSALNSVRLACATDDPTKAHAALINWGKLQWPDVALFNLSELNTLVDNITLKQQIHLLSEVLYGKNIHGTWKGQALWQAVKHYRHNQSEQKTTRRKLPPMNPIDIT